MASPMLKTGDPCPCCGQPIKTTDPAALALLTHIRDSGCISHEYMLHMGEISHASRRQST